MNLQSKVWVCAFSETGENFGSKEVKTVREIMLGIDEVTDWGGETSVCGLQAYELLYSLALDLGLVIEEYPSMDHLFADVLDEVIKGERICLL